MATIIRNDNRYVAGNEEVSCKSSKPVMFEYASAQKPGGFDEVSYDYEDDVNKIRGKSVIEYSHTDTVCLTKTKVERESDDSPNAYLMIPTTKTDTQREVDDSPPVELALATTKTYVERESDDNIDPYVLLLTKTEEARETDE